MKRNFFVLLLIIFQVINKAEQQYHECRQQYQHEQQQQQHSHLNGQQKQQQQSSSDDGYYYCNNSTQHTHEKNRNKYTPLERNVRDIPLLLFPRTSPTRIQGYSGERTFISNNIIRVWIIAGIGVPVSLKRESVTIGYVLKVEYFLPENVSNVLDILADPFNPPMQQPITAGRRRRYERTILSPSSASSSESSSLPSLPTSIIAADDHLQISRQNNYDNNDKNNNNNNNFIPFIDGEKSEKYTVEAKEIEFGKNIKHNRLSDNTDNDDEHEEMVEDEEYENDEFDDNENDNDDDDDDDNNDEDDEDENNNQFSLADIKLKKPNNMATSRFQVYRGIEAMAINKGIQGRPCMLKMICESAAVQFTHEHGILGELAHILMTPSTSQDEIVKPNDLEYLKAEQLGRSGEDCDNHFKECPESALNKFSGIYETLENLINVLG